VGFAAEALLPAAAVVAGVEVAPVLAGAALAFGVAELGNDAISTFDPRFDEQVLHSAEAGASVVASGVQDVFSLARHNPLNWVPAF
jgi:hypothetical protein